MWISSLSWSDVDPALRPFDPSGLERALGDELLRRFGRRDLPRNGTFITTVTEWITGRYGVWALGWAFSLGEGSSGGVVSAWCCESHSLPRRFATDQEVQETARKVAAALGQWREHLERMRALFATVALPSGKEALEAELEGAVLKVLARVAEETGCEDAWYSYAQQAVAWLFEALGASREEAVGAASEAFQGRFESWVAPDAATMKEGAELAAAGFMDATRLG